MNKKKLFVKTIVFGTALLVLAVLSGVPAFSQAVPGGTLDPLTVPKYVTPLVIPPVMNNNGTQNDYDIAVRQFQQQILPGGIWTGGAGGLPATTVWSYGPRADTLPDSSGIPGGALGVAPALAAQSQFNYPAFTVENTVNTPSTVDWYNDLVVDPIACAASATPATDPACNFLPHLLPIDQTLHWANPPGGLAGRDSRGTNPLPYLGPVPIITHVHGAHVGPESDGYPEAWYLPDANNIPGTYATLGSLVNQYAKPTNTTPGVANFSYPNDQPSTTLWYHDHTLGMTRNNVYAGPAGFWLIREDDGGETGLVSGTLPGPAPIAGEDPNFVPADRTKIREIPIAIQDRSFNADGSLFYPNNRAFFEGIAPNKLKIPFIGDPSYPSDISPIWNPEFFGNMMVVNGTTWPNLDVEPDIYRFRLLNGCNSRFLNLSLQALDAAGIVLGEISFYQIGAEQSLLPNVVEVRTGERTVYPGGGVAGISTFTDPQLALLMGLAERADVLVDFSNLPLGTTKVRMINTAPDAPFGGFPDIPSDPATTGQVMEFTLVANTTIGDNFTAPQNLVLSLPDPGDPAATVEIQDIVRDLALIEEESALVCVNVKPNGSVSYDKSATPDGLGGCIDKKGRLAKSIPFAPKAAVLGTGGNTGAPTVTLWSSPIATRPVVGDTETWELYNYTVDGHPIHLHLVKFKVVNRELFNPATGTPSGSTLAAEATEIGWKDTVIAYPGQVTRLNATFDIDGLYVWHCHIVEHEDNEMMVPYCVDKLGGGDGDGCAGL